MTKNADKPELFSTSRLAKLLGVDGKVLFHLLSEQHWMEHVDDKWLLTSQGEYHGGEYQHSDKFGDYIVWPATLVDNPLLQQLDGVMLTVSKIAQHYQVAASTMNLLLGNLGWIDKDQRGWMLTDLGSKLGGEMRTSKQGFFVLWPAAIRQNALFIQAIETLNATKVGLSLDGHHCESAEQQKICNWLYLHGLVHASQQVLPGQDFLKADFFIPQRKVYIDFWDVNDCQLPLSLRLEKQVYYKNLGLKHIELSQQDMTHMDEVLAQRLLQFGVQLY